MRVVRALIAEAEAQGASREGLLRASGLSSDQLDADEARIPRSTSSRICESVMDVTGDPAFGLHWAERLTESSFPPITNLFIHSTSLREAFDALHRFSRLLSDEAKFEVVEEPGRVIVKRVDNLSDALSVRRFRAEMFTVGLLNQIRRVTPQALPSVVSFAYPAPAHRAEYARLFAGTERFDQPFTGLVFDGALLNGHSAHQDSEMQGALHSLAVRRLLRITRNTPYSHRVREALVREGWPHRMDMQSVARCLRISVRSLRRRLSDEGIAYGTLLNEALASIAVELLCDDGRTIQQVSEAMGFTDKSTFHRAFKRWTGRTPNEYRRSVART